MSLPLSPESCARLDVRAAALLSAVVIARSLIAAKSITEHFVLLAAIFSAPLLLVCAASRLVPRWYLKPPTRIALVLLVRLVTTATCAVPYHIPEPSCTSCIPFSGLWLINSHCLTLCFVALGFPLPLSIHVLATAGQLAALGVMAAGRCAGAAGGAYVPFHDHFPEACFAGLAQILDWPLHMVAPHVMLMHGGMSPAASCLATTLWVQAALGLILPTTVLWAMAGRQRRLQPPGRGQGRGQGLPAGARCAVHAALDACLGDQPVLVACFVAQMLWLLIRTACHYFLPPLPA